MLLALAYNLKTKQKKQTGKWLERFLDAKERRSESGKKNMNSDNRF